jgi:hypothetical protein
MPAIWLVVTSLVVTREVFVPELILAAFTAVLFIALLAVFDILAG